MSNQYNLELIKKLKAFQRKEILVYQDSGIHYVKISDIADFIGDNATRIARELKTNNKTQFIHKVSSINGNCFKVEELSEALKNNKRKKPIEWLKAYAEQSKQNISKLIINSDEKIVNKTDYDSINNELRDLRAAKTRLDLQLSNALRDKQSFEQQASNRVDAGNVRIQVATAINRTTSELNLNHANEINSLEVKHSAKIAKLTSEHTTEIAKLTSGHTAEISKLTSEHTTEIETLENKHKKVAERFEVALKQNLTKSQNETLEQFKKQHISKDQHKGIVDTKINQLYSELNAEFDVQKNKFKKSIEDLQEQLNIALATVIEKESNILDLQLTGATITKNPIAAIAKADMMQALYLLVVIFGTMFIAYNELQASVGISSDIHWTGRLSLVLVSVSLGLAIVWTSMNTNHIVWTNLAVFIFAGCEWASFSEFIGLSEALVSTNVTWIRKIGLCFFSLLLPSLTVLLSKYSNKASDKIQMSVAIEVLINTLTNTKFDGGNTMVLVNDYKKEIVLIAEHNNKDFLMVKWQQLTAWLKNKFTFK